MVLKILKSEKGFGLIHVLAVLIIVSISITGLVFSSAYARYKAVENYHYRAALLACAEKMEYIKFFNRGQGKIPTFDQSLYTNNTVILDDEDGKSVKGTFNYHRSGAVIDNSIAYYVEYYVVTVTLKWEEPSMMFFPPKQRQISLREDYFRRRDT